MYKLFKQTTGTTIRVVRAMASPFLIAAVMELIQPGKGGQGTTE
jgi:hypothetical protein